MWGKQCSEREHYTVQGGNARFNIATAFSDSISGQMSCFTSLKSQHPMVLVQAESGSPFIQQSIRFAWRGCDVRAEAITPSFMVEKGTMQT